MKTATKKTKSIRTHENIDSICVEFIKVINEWLTDQQIAIVNERNAQPDMKGSCATHDFYDANMAMDEAFKKAMGGQIDLQSDDDMFLWNEAWDLAKDNKFKLTEQYEYEND